MTKLPIILGSASRWRKEILNTAGIEFRVMSPDIDEKAIRHTDPNQLVSLLAKAKNAALVDNLSEPAILITCDQVVVCNGSIYEKPESANQAREYLESYRFHPAETVTGVLIENTKTKQTIEVIDRATVHFKSISDQLILDAIDDGEIFYCAGGFQIEGNKVLSDYIEKVEGELDSVKGLPTKKVLAAIAQLQNIRI